METLNTKMPIELTERSINHLSDLRKWSMFISIVGFIFIGIFILLTPILLFTTGFDNKMGYGPVFILPFLLIMAIYFFPIYFLYQFSSYSKKAIANSNSYDLETALKYHKLHYQFMGIMLIVVLGIYLFAGITALIVSLLT